MNRNLPMLRVLPILLLLVLSACGSVSNLSRDERPQRSPADFQRVLVEDFGNGTEEPRRVALRAAHEQQVRIAGQQFADRIAEALRSERVFDLVDRAGEPQAALLIRGQITRYRESNAVGRYIGLGIGNAYFDADLEFVDGDSGEVIARMQVDRNSWPLGGLAGAVQTVDHFMRGAAERVARELAKARGISVAEQPAADEPMP